MKRAPGTQRATAPSTLVPSDQNGDQGPAISVVVCTRRRVEMLDACLAALAAQTHPQFEVIVVHNDVLTDGTEEVCARRRTVYVREPEVGLGRARNRGIRESRYPIVAFCDDDTRPKSDWLATLGEVFRSPGVHAVTGRVVALEPVGEVESLFEIGCGGMDKGDKPRVYRRSRARPWREIHTQEIGVGANMAFRREVLDRLGGFDVWLGAGTMASSAEDLDIFHRTLMSGVAIHYVPSAVVAHRHRSSLVELGHQMEDAGRGFGVYLLKLASAAPSNAPAVVMYAFLKWFPWHLWRLVRGLFGKHPLPLPLLVAHARGALDAPRAYRESRVQWQTTKVGVKPVLPAAPPPSRLAAGINE